MSWDIQLGNMCEKYNGEIQRRNTFEEYSQVIQLGKRVRNKVKAETKKLVWNRFWWFVVTGGGGFLFYPSVSSQRKMQILVDARPLRLHCQQGGHPHRGQSLPHCHSLVRVRVRVWGSDIVCSSENPNLHLFTPPALSTASCFCWKIWLSRITVMLQNRAEKI